MRGSGGPNTRLDDLEFAWKRESQKVGRTCPSSMSTKIAIVAISLSLSLSLSHFLSVIVLREVSTADETYAGVDLRNKRMGVYRTTDSARHPSDSPW